MNTDTETAPGSPLNKNDLALLDIEEQCLTGVLEKLDSQLQWAVSKLSRERIKARELTSEMVNAQQAEDKQLLASDEAVAHALSVKVADDLEVLDRLKDSPYFARFIVSEEFEGKKVEREYKLGKHANPDCRIIDWRKAPIAKIYYEYRPGDNFYEEIQGQEREGTVLLRHAVDIKKSALKSISTGTALYKKINGQWTSNNSNNKANGGQQGKLPEVLSLISAEQFSMITQAADTAILLQGVAGSGKTTVALHRLSWLVAEGNTDCRKENCLILAESPALRTYIQNSMQSLDLTGIKVLAYEEWSLSRIRRLCPDLFETDNSLRKNTQNCPQSVKRFLASLSLLEYIENNFVKFNSDNNPISILINACLGIREIIELDQSKLINKDLITESKRYLENCQANQEIHPVLEPLIVRIDQLLNPASINKLDHILVDEVQDASPVKLATLLASVDSPARLTLVGDTAQSFNKSNHFQGWDALKKRWQEKSTDANYISLEVSHRSSLQIMKLADYVQNRNLVEKGRNGRTPIVFQQRNEESAIASAINWLKQAMDRYPTEITAVICATRQHAKNLEGLLKPTFGGQLRLEVGGVFSFDSGIIITSIKDVRGLEFTNVLLWDVSQNNYPRVPVAQNALYIAITRAAENLCFVCWNRRSPLLPDDNSKLIRLYREALPA